MIRYSLLIILYLVMSSACKKVTLKNNSSTTDKKNLNNITSNSIVNINSEDFSGYKREVWPITGGIPLPRGLTSDPSIIKLKGVETQTKVLSRWSDGSIKWILLDYQTDIASKSKTEHALTLNNSSIKSTEKMATEDTTKVTVDTGSIKFTISKVHFSLIEDLWYDTNNNHIYDETTEHAISQSSNSSKQFFDTQNTPPTRPQYTYSAKNLISGEQHTVANSTPTNPAGPIWFRPGSGGTETRYQTVADGYTVTIKENGPLKTVIELKGRFESTTSNSYEANRFSIYLHAFKNQSFLKVQHTFLQRGNPRVDYMRRLGISLPLNLQGQLTFKASEYTSGRTLANGENGYLYNSGPRDVFHLYHKGFHLPSQVGINNTLIAESNLPTKGWIDITGSNFGVTTVIKDMALMYPKEISFNSGTKLLTVWPWPDHEGDVLDLNATGWTEDETQGMHGISFTHEFFYKFHVASNFDSDAFAAKINSPVRPYANSNWYSYKGTKAAGMIMPLNTNKFPKTENYLSTATTMLARSAKEFGWLGMLNFGDIMQDYSYNESGKVGTWGLSDRPDNYGGWRHGNTMLSYRIFMQYLRTGNYKFWQMGDAHLKHVRDVLIKHYSKFRHESPNELQWRGMGRRHSAYFGASTSIDKYGGVSTDGYGTNWAGHYLHWNLTGDWRTYDVLQEFRSMWNEFGNNEWLSLLSGTAFVALKLIGEIPGMEEAVNEAENYKTLAVSNAQSTTHEWRDATWFFGYGLYLQDYIPADPDIKTALINYGEKNPGKDQYGLFWNRDSLSVAYWAAAGNKELQSTIYNNLLLNATEKPENAPTNNTLVTRQMELSSQYSMYELFNIPMNNLSLAVTNNSYWRIKDDLIQLQWDEPLNMAVLNHFEENNK